MTLLAFPHSGYSMLTAQRDLGAHRQGGRKTGVPGEKPSESDRD